MALIVPVLFERSLTFHFSPSFVLSFRLLPMYSAMAADIKTRILFLPDTHGKISDSPMQRADVVIHSGNLTNVSRLGDYQSIMATLETINASLKLVIPGIHDLALEKTGFMKANGIILLGKGSHTFHLANGARLKVYADPYTPLMGTPRPGRDPYSQVTFNIESDTDIVITQVAPRGVMDSPSYYGVHTGCQDLFAGVAKARPKIHCFAHGHEARGARLVRWNDINRQKKTPTYLDAITKDLSTWIDELPNIAVNHSDDQEMPHRMDLSIAGLACQGCPATGDYTCEKHIFWRGRHTLFINASVESKGQQPPQFGMTPIDSQKPLLQRRWLVDVKLPAAQPPPSPALSASSYDLVDELDENSWPTSDETAISRAP
jgi:hypothetical protein